MPYAKEFKIFDIDGVPVIPDVEMFLPNLATLIVIVCPPENADEMTTSSCGNGTLVVQALADQLPPDVPDHVCVAGVVKVMPLLLPQSPLPPLIDAKFHEPAPAPTMSWKSVFVTVTDPAVIVLCVPGISDCKYTLLIEEFPLHTKDVAVTLPPSVVVE